MIKVSSNRRSESSPHTKWNECLVLGMNFFMISASSRWLPCRDRVAVQPTLSWKLACNHITSERSGSHPVTPGPSRPMPLPLGPPPTWCSCVALGWKPAAQQPTPLRVAWSNLCKFNFSWQRTSPALTGSLLDLSPLLMPQRATCLAFSINLFTYFGE